MSNDYTIADIVDLTDSFILSDHYALSNAIINLDTDDSFSIDTSFVNSESNSLVLTSKKKSVDRKKSLKKKTTLRPKRVISKNPEKDEKMRSSSFGDCPICWDELGENPLASTKCGHVFCIKCLEQTLIVEKKCPSCRKILKGSSAYHPLYLSKS